MANFQLVVLPLLISIALLSIALIFFIWMKIKLKKRQNHIPGKTEAGIFGYSLIVLAGFSLFISLFFLITG